MQKFNYVTNEASFIKALLFNTPIPIIDAVTNGDYIIRGFAYIYNYDVIFCNSSGYVSEGGADRVFSDGVARWTYLYEFNYRDHYILFEERFMSNCNYYDSDTHEQLGKYLRYYRGRTGIDLMPLYNCFSNRQIPNIRIDTEKNTVYKHYASNHTKVYKVPIKFNYTYSIAIDCPSPVKIAGCFLDQNNILEIAEDLNNILWRKAGSIQSFSTMDFINPVKFSITNKTYADESLLKEFEKDLYLLIQLPESNNSSIVIIEGDYDRHLPAQIFSYDHLDDINLKTQNRLMQSELSLLKFNDNEQHPYSPRLIEYLTGNAITPEDSIPKNIYRINQMLTKGDHFDLIHPNLDIWEDDLRFAIYKYQLENFATRVDQNGYIDKDTEFKLVKEEEIREALAAQEEANKTPSNLQTDHGYWSGS